MLVNDFDNNTQILNELGKRLKQTRINFNLTQDELATKCGVSLATIIRIENGNDVKISNYINVLRGLLLVKNLEILVPETQVSVVELYDKIPQKKRISKRSRNKLSSGNRQPWGDEV